MAFGKGFFTGEIFRKIQRKSNLAERYCQEIFFDVAQ